VTGSWAPADAGVSAAAEKRFPAVILSEAKNLALRIFMNIRDSSSPAAAQNDSAYEFFRSLFYPLPRMLEPASQQFRHSRMTMP
jgi:hypothetical protein